MYNLQIVATDNYKADISAEVKQISTVAVSRFEREFKILRFHKNMTHFYYRLNYVDQACKGFWILYDTIITSTTPLTDAMRDISQGR